MSESAPTRELSLIEVLLDDIAQHNAEDMNECDSRALIRAIYAAIEGLLSELRAALNREASARLLGPELALLNDEQYSVANDGSVQSRELRQTLKDRIKFT